MNSVDWAMGGGSTACAARRAGEKAKTTCLRAAVRTTMQSPVPHRCRLPLPQTRGGQGHRLWAPLPWGGCRVTGTASFHRGLLGAVGLYGTHPTSVCCWSSRRLRVPREARPGELSRVGGPLPTRASVEQSGPRIRLRSMCSKLMTRNSYKFLQEQGFQVCPRRLNSA